MNITEHSVNGLVYLSADGIDAAGGAVHGFPPGWGACPRGFSPP